MKLSRVIAIAVAVLLLAGGAIAFLRWRGGGGAGSSTPFHFQSLFGAGTNHVENQESRIKNHESGILVYTHPTLGFSFKYPAGFHITSFDEGDGEMVLVKKSEIRSTKSETNSNVENSKPETSELQIYVSPFDEPGPITPQRIKKDIPDMVIEEPQEVMVGKHRDIRALVFFSREGAMRLRQVWFVAAGYLYQISSEEANGSFMQSILNSWEF